MPKLPKRFTDFQKKYPEVAKAYEELGTAVHSACPLSDKERALVNAGCAVLPINP